MTISAPFDAGQDDPERSRVAALHRYHVLDTQREASFDRLAGMAARVLGTPMAAVSLVDTDRIWFKARIGIGPEQVPREQGLCLRTVAAGADVHEVPDTHADPTLAGNPLLLPPVGIRFYAGAALVTPDGFRIGTLCVIDRVPRPNLTEEQRATLIDLAGAVMTELERRREQTLRETAAARLALVNDVLARAGGATGFVAAVEAALSLLCRHTGALNGQLWTEGAGPPVRALAFAVDGDVTPERRANFLRLFAEASARSPRLLLPDGDGFCIVPEVTAELAARLPLVRVGYTHGMRAFLLQPLTVGGERFGLVLSFGTPRDDLAEVSELVTEVALAIRPALLRKQAEQRLALLNDVLATIAGAPGFVAGIEGAITLLCRHTGAFFGHFWDQLDQGAAVRLLALAGPAELPAEARARAFADFPVPAASSLLAPVLAAGGRMLLPSIPDELAARYKLLRASVDLGLRSLAAQAFAVGDARYMLILAFDTPRGDLDQIGDLLAEMAQAIRPAVLRKQAEDRLALFHDVIASVAGAAGFRDAIEAVLERFCRHVGALWGLMWDKVDGADLLRLVAVRAGQSTLPNLPAIASAAFPLPASQSLLAPLLDSEGSRVIPAITAEMVARHPLIAVGHAAGMRSFAAQSLVVGPRRYVLCFTFATERDDLDQVADLLVEIGRAIRPALQRKQAEDQQALLQAAVDASSDAIVVTDAAASGPADRRVLRINPAFTRMTGYSAGETLGRNMRFLQGPGTDPAVLDRLRAAVLARRATRVELLNYRRDGTPFWVELDIAPFADERGEVANWVGVLRDSTERRATQEALQGLAAALQDRTAQLTEMARLARIGSWVWHATSDVMDWSDETFDLLGVSRDSFVPTAEAFFALLHPDDVARARAAGAHAMATGTDLYVEARVLQPAGRARAITWSARPRRDADGRITAFAGYCQDVTERRETEAALRHGEKLRALGKLTGGIAHEFNNILTIVQANLEIALDDADHLADARPELEAARRATQAGTELTGRLLSFARSEPLRSEPTDIGAWLAPLRDMATRTIGSRYRITLRADPALAPVAVDRSQLEGAVLNLILNARDAMPTGGTIAIETEPMEVPPGARGALADLLPGRYAVVAVRDGGAGMPPDVAERAFEPFFTTKPSGNGTGLGLSMVLSFTRQSGGTTLLDTAPGRGTTVRMVLALG